MFPIKIIIVEPNVNLMNRVQKISISLKPDVLEKINEIMEAENRNRSNAIDTILRKHFQLPPIKSRETLTLEERRKRSRPSYFYRE